MDDIASQIGVKPNLKAIFKSDPMFGLRCLFGPCVPAQYRLQGTGKWEGAKEAVAKAMERSLAPMNTRILPKNFSSKKSVDKLVITIPKYLKSYFVLAFIVFFLFCMCVV